MYLSKKGLAALIVLGMASFGFGNYTYIKGKEYKVFCCNGKDYLFYSASICDKKISWREHVETEQSGLSLICSACHTIHS